MQFFFVMLMVKFNQNIAGKEYSICVPSKSIHFQTVSIGHILDKMAIGFECLNVVLILGSIKKATDNNLLIILLHLICSFFETSGD